MGHQEYMLEMKNPTVASLDLINSTVDFHRVKAPLPLLSAESDAQERGSRDAPTLRSCAFGATRAMRIYWASLFRIIQLSPDRSDATLLFRVSKPGNVSASRRRKPDTRCRASGTCFYHVLFDTELRTISKR
jgi:hypothetical protein